jgi:hypothetical protein
MPAASPGSRARGIGRPAVLASTSAGRPSTLVGVGAGAVRLSLGR